MNSDIVATIASIIILAAAIWAAFVVLESVAKIVRDILLHQLSKVWCRLLCSPMKDIQNFLRGTIIHSSYYRKIPTTAFYTGENVQPQSFQINRSINITIDHQRILLIPIVSNTAIGENNFIPITENH